MVRPRVMALLFVLVALASTITAATAASTSVSSGPVVVTATDGGSGVGPTFAVTFGDGVHGGLVTRPPVVTLTGVPLPVCVCATSCALAQSELNTAASHGIQIHPRRLCCCYLLLPAVYGLKCGVSDGHDRGDFDFDPLWHSHTHATFMRVCACTPAHAHTRKRDLAYAPLKRTLTSLSFHSHTSLARSRRSPSCFHPERTSGRGRQQIEQHHDSHVQWVDSCVWDTVVQPARCR
jgi:hypothetical protein